MNILLVIKNFDLGGAERHVCVLANSLADRGERVFLVSRRGLQAGNLRKNVIYIPLRISEYLLPLHLFMLFFLIRKEKIEIIHAHQRLAILLANLAGKITGVRVIATVHGRIKYDLRSEFVKKRTSRVITVSENGFKGAKNDGYLRHKSLLITNSINPDFVHAERNKEQNIVYCAGRLDKRHSRFINLLIESVWPEIILKDDKALLSVTGVGEGKDQILDSIEKFNRRFGQEKISFNGFLSNQPAGLHQASLVLGVGRIAIESLGAGIPVFSVNAKHCGEIITTGNYSTYRYGNFVAIDSDPPTPDAIIKTINEFLSRKNYFSEEAEKLRVIVRSDFNNESVVTQTLDLYKSVINSK